MKWKAFFSDFLTFSRKDRLGVLVLVLLIVLIYALPYLAPSKVTPPVFLTDSLLSWADSSRPAQVAGYRSEPGRWPARDRQNAETNIAVRAELFRFDPNTLDEAGWRRLGLPERATRTLLNYRNKGGRFYKPEDLQRVWALPEGFYDRVAPYVDIPDSKRTSGFPQAELQKSKPAATTPVIIDINAADTTGWIGLPGIGPKLAARIVNFRDKLGGFVHVDQVGETYGLPDSTFQRLKARLALGNNPVRKLAINTATREELSAHPYVNWSLAKAIIAYRQQHGPLKSPDDLAQIHLVDNKTLERLLPYLQFD